MMRCIALIGLLVFGCADAQSPRCTQVCDREAECIEQIQDEEDRPPFDRRECVSDCTMLVRDREGKDLAEAHFSCVDRARTCPELLACE